MSPSRVASYKTPEWNAMPQTAKVVKTKGSLRNCLVPEEPQGPQQVNAMGKIGYKLKKYQGSMDFS